MNAEEKLNDLFKKIEELKTVKENDRSKAHDAVVFTRNQIEEKKTKLSEAIENADAKAAAKLASEVSANEQILRSLEEKETETTNKRYLTFEQYKEVKTSMYSALAEMEKEAIAKIAKYIPEIRASMDNCLAFSEKASDAVYEAYLSLYNPELPMKNEEYKILVARNESHMPYPQDLPIKAIEKLEEMLEEVK